MSITNRTAGIQAGGADVYHAGVTGLHWMATRSKSDHRRASARRRVPGAATGTADESARCARSNVRSSAKPSMRPSVARLRGAARMEDTTRFSPASRRGQQRKRSQQRAASARRGVGEPFPAGSPFFWSGRAARPTTRTDWITLAPPPPCFSSSRCAAFAGQAPCAPSSPSLTNPRTRGISAGSGEQSAVLFLYPVRDCELFREAERIRNTTTVP